MDLGTYQNGSGKNAIAGNDTLSRGVNANTCLQSLMMVSSYRRKQVVVIALLLLLKLGDMKDGGDEDEGQGAGGIEMTS